MKFYLLFSVSGVLFCCTLVTKTKSQDTFSSVTIFPGLSRLYARMRIREAHLQPDTTTDADTKKRICQSITGSAFFSTQKRYPLDTDTIYKQLKSEAEKEEKRSYGGIIYFRKLVDDFEQKPMWRMVYNYPSKLIDFVSGSIKEEEYAFACVIRHAETNGIVIYYVSDVYNINTALDVPTEGQISARFVCLAAYSACILQALAEEPSTFFPADDAVEDIYLQMRKLYNPADEETDDPVCGLTKSDKVRVCASVLTSSYFVDKVDFQPKLEDFVGECKSRQVSVKMAKDTEYKELMLSCPVEPKVGPAAFTYYVSRAYYSHHAVVYARHHSTGEWYIHSIHGNISVIIDESASETSKESFNLINLLKNLKISKNKDISKN